jgi:hypothetical protein
MHLPPEALQLTTNFSIADDVPLEFCLPEIDARFRHIGKRTISVAMPEAAVHQERDSPSRKDYVRGARKIAPMKPKSEPQPVQSAPNCHFRGGIAGPDSGHHRASFGRDRVFLQRRFFL